MKEHPYISLVANLLRLGGNLCHLMSLALLQSFGLAEERKGNKKPVEDIKPKE